jgi:hypothetical protein
MGSVQILVIAPPAGELKLLLFRQQRESVNVAQILLKVALRRRFDKTCNHT